MKRIKNVFALALICAIAVVAFPTFTVKAEETFIWAAEVSSYNGLPQISPVLEAGVQYRIVATGAFWYSTEGLPSGGLAADAQYYTTIPHELLESWDNHLPAPAGASFLQINEQNVSWGSFNMEHTYTIYYMGTGEAISFRIFDWIDFDTYNNLCHIEVEIWKPTMGEGYTPGFWKNHPEAWEGYMTNQPVGDVFDVFGTMPDEYHCDLGDFTLMEALRFKGGPGLYGAASILLRASVAAVLNAAHSDVDYPLTDSEIVEQVNAAIASHSRSTMLDLAEQLDMYNNLGGSWD